MLDEALAYAGDQSETHLAELCDWLRIASISTLSEHAADVEEAAAWADAKLRKIGFEKVRIDKTPGLPVVYGEWLGTDGPTLLIYGHFDVQPVDPLEAWDRLPFDPQVAGDNLYARGASDDKGQAFALLAALESYLQSSGQLPSNVKVILEGEEEISSPHLPGYIRDHREELKADAVLIADQDMLDPQLPVIMFGVRGLLYVEIEVRGPVHDLHSGTFGGAVDNPFNVLCRLLANLQEGDTRRVLIPGFYDTVQEISAEEKELIAHAPITEQVGLHFTGAPALGGETGYSLAERISVRPTLEIHGIQGGFTGEGKKTVIPSRAAAKVSMRLVPNQIPSEVFDLLYRYLMSKTPDTVRLEMRVLGESQPVRIDYRTPAVQVAELAYRRGFGAQARYLRGGGSLPVVSDLIATLSPAGGEAIPVVMIGFGLPDDHTHAPNEKIHLPNFYRGIKTMIHYCDLFAGIQT